MTIARRFFFCLTSLALVSGSLATTTPIDEGTTVLGAGFVGKPFVLTGDVVMETIGYYEAIRDYSVATEPAWIGWNVHDQVEDIDGGYWRDVLYDNGLLVALHDNYFPTGLSIVDLTDLTTPVPLAAIQGNTYTSGWLRDGLLVVSLPTYMMVYDLSVPSLPSFRSIVLLGERSDSRWFSAVGSTLYGVDHGVLLRGLDVSDPQHPVDLGTVPLPGDRIDAMVANDGHLHVLLATENGPLDSDLELVTFDVTTPMAPVETDRRFVTSGRDPRGVTMERAERLLLAATNDDQVHAFGLDDPAHPTDGWQLDREANHLAIGRNQIFVATQNGMEVYARTDAGTPPGPALKRMVLPRLKTVAGNGPIQIAQQYELSSLLAPVDVSNAQLPHLGPWFDVGLEGDLVVVDGLGLIRNVSGRCQLIELSDPTEPYLLGSITDTESYFLSAFITRDLVVLETAGGDDWVRIFDISDPDQPRPAGVANWGSPRYLGDGFMISSFGDLILTIGLSDPNRPDLLRTLDVGESVQEVGMRDDYAYVLTLNSSTTRTLQVLDLSDVTEPEIVTVVPVDFTANHLAFNADRLYLTGYHESRIFDISNPITPVEAAQFPYPGDTGYGIAFNGNVTTASGWLITRRDDGFEITDVPGAEHGEVCRLEPAFPNPFNPTTSLAFTVDRTRELAVTVHDLRGRTVATLAQGTFAPGKHSVSWHGLDAGGRAAASGVYLVRLHGPGLEASRTVTLVK